MYKCLDVYSVAVSVNKSGFFFFLRGNKTPAVKILQVSVCCVRLSHHIHHTQCSSISSSFLRQHGLKKISLIPPGDPFWWSFVLIPFLVHVFFFPRKTEFYLYTVQSLNTITFFQFRSVPDFAYISSLCAMFILTYSSVFENERNQIK